MSRETAEMVWEAIKWLAVFAVVALAAYGVALAGLRGGGS